MLEKIHQRKCEEQTLEVKAQVQLEQYLLKRKQERPNFASMPSEQLYELTELRKDGQFTLTAVLLFSLYPQAYFPQLSIIASRVPGTEMGEVDEAGQRFLDSKRIEGNLPEMLEGAVGFLRNNMRVAVRIDLKTGRRQDMPEYPLDALREAVLNALVHRDYSTHTENMPIQLTMFYDRPRAAEHFLQLLTVFQGNVCAINGDQAHSIPRRCSRVLRVDLCDSICKFPYKFRVQICSGLGKRLLANCFFLKVFKQFVRAQLEAIRKPLQQEHEYPLCCKLSISGKRSAFSRKSGSSPQRFRWFCVCPQQAPSYPFLPPYLF